MKKLYFFISITGIVIVALFFYSCEKNNKKPELETLSGKKKGALILTTVPESDTVHFSEADSIFTIAVAHGLRTSFEGKYPYVIPHLKLSSLFFLNNGQVALYVPIGLDPVTGKRLTMVIFKEHGVKRVAFTEHEPTPTSRKINADYNQLTGTLRFYNYSGVVVRAFQMQGGDAIAEIPVGGGTSFAKTNRSINQKLTTSGNGGPYDPDSDEDDDGVLNKDDKCWNTPQGIMVDAQGCPKVYYMDAFSVYGNPSTSGFVGFWPEFTINPGVEPSPDITNFFPTTEPLSLEQVPNVPSGLPGIMCGSVSTRATGNAQTGQVQNLGGKYKHMATGTEFNVTFSQACIEVAATNSGKASNIIIDAFNFATETVLKELNAGEIPPNTVLLKAAIKSEFIANMNAIAPGSTFSEGPCIGANIPITVAKYYDPTTGNCQ